MPIDLPPLMTMPAGYERRASGLIAPSRRIERRSGLPGFGAAPGLMSGRAIATATLVSSSYDASDLTTYTFSGLSFGAAGGGRYIIVMGTARQTSTRTISSVTIGGVSATVLQEAGNSGTSAFAAIALVPTGTSGDVVVVWSGSELRCGVAVYRVTGLLSTTLVDFATSSANPASLNCDVQAGGFAIATCHTGQNGTSVSWSGLAEDSTQLQAAWESNANMTTASQNFTANETNRTISQTWGASSTPVGLAISMR